MWLWLWRVLVLELGLGLLWLGLLWLGLLWLIWAVVVVVVGDVNRGVVSGGWCCVDGAGPD